ncbi:MAG: GGDEF domain-containing protein [Treponema sp.]|nr:GGDEF domain-containing protein [Treponema sp.]
MARTAAYYYSVIDTFCIIILVILLFTTLMDVDRNKYRLRLINLMLALIAFCLVDTFWVLIYQGVLPKTQFLRMLSNLFLYCAINACSFSMFLLLNGCLEMVHPTKYNKKLPFIPFWILIAITLTTPWTGWLFSIDEFGNLHRGILYIPFMIGIMGDLLLTSVRATLLAFRPENEGYKELCLLVAFYGLPILIGGLIRAFFVSLPSVALGTFISVILFFVMSIREQVSIDTLTGINNRRQGERFFIRQIRVLNQKEGDTDGGLYLFMADLDKFKGINDRYGHAEGDNALSVTAEALREACSQYADRCMLCRFGGDEFVLGGMFWSDDQADSFCTMLKEAVAAKCAQKSMPYTISLSIGYERYRPEYRTLKNLLTAADKKMYEQKRSR